MEKRGAGIKSLAQGTAHKQIPDISYQNDKGHLQIGCICHNYGKFRVFTCGGMVQHTGYKSLKGVQPGFFGNNAQRKCYCKVSKGDGNAVAHTV